MSSDRWYQKLWKSFTRMFRVGEQKPSPHVDMSDCMEEEEEEEESTRSTNVELKDARVCAAREELMKDFRDKFESERFQGPLCNG
ncbi:hypothetical protein TNCT_250291 [Trichonephila clavata]|uniref:Uncharacterized protein n=1 Tax=Trichonephila clavata TaxID=2740835 RepID=A0A8X6FEW0_TRICU|nr:hypothetical protein TNCT_250291 [Trichonephila clavata]